jgi:hypothetical protein
LALSTLTLAAAMMVATATYAARQPHPWCLIVQDQDGVWACAFDTFQQCTVEARSGNTGFCAANPAYQAPEVAPPARHKRRTRSPD